MNKNKSSQTALVVCLIRAASYREKIAGLKSEDRVAEKLVPRVFRVLVRLPYFRQHMRRRLPGGTYEYVVSRTKYIDEVMQRAVEEQWGQVVILGAGYDSRGIRLVDETSKTVVYEVDAASTQEEKRKKLQKAGVKVMPWIRYVVADLNQNEWKEKLMKAGFDGGKRALWIAEGVLMYLAAAAADELLKEIRSLSASGSEVVFDYIEAKTVRGESEDEGGKAARKIVNQVNEAWRFGIDGERVEEFVRDRGFEVVKTVTAEELGERYLKPVPEKVKLNLSRVHGVIRIKVWR